MIGSFRENRKQAPKAKLGRKLARVAADGRKAELLYSNNSSSLGTGHTGVRVVRVDLFYSVKYIPDILEVGMLTSTG